MTEASMISRDCNLEHLANSLSIARVHISNFSDVIVLLLARCLHHGKCQVIPTVLQKDPPAHNKDLLSKNSIK